MNDLLALPAQNSLENDEVGHVHEMRCELAQSFPSQTLEWNCKLMEEQMLEEQVPEAQILEAQMKGRGQKLSETKRMTTL